MSDIDSSVELKPIILDALPDFIISGHHCSTHIQKHIDLILLALEALDLGTSEQMLTTIKLFNLQKIIKNRIVLWRLRSTNPWRRAYNRSVLSIEQAKALIIITNHHVKPLTSEIRQLLLAEQQMTENNLPVTCHFLLAEYLDQFRAHFHSRMNPSRTKVSLYLGSEQKLNELALMLLKKLLFCTGTSGMQRLWVSLFDGEVI